MALCKSFKSVLFRTNHKKILLIHFRNHWNKDYKPGLFPATQESKDAAAKKYGLLPEEYRVFKDGALGDYPDLNSISGDQRDPFYPWDKPELKQNFKEPIDENEQFKDEVHYDVSARHRVPYWTQFGQFFFVVGSAFFLIWTSSHYKMFLPLFPIQYPDQPHYKFELGQEGEHHRKSH